MWSLERHRVRRHSCVLTCTLRACVVGPLIGKMAPSGSPVIDERRGVRPIEEPLRPASASTSSVLTSCQIGAIGAGMPAPSKHDFPRENVPGFNFPMRMFVMRMDCLRGHCRRARLMAWCWRCMRLVACFHSRGSLSQPVSSAANIRKEFDPVEIPLGSIE